MDSIPKVSIGMPVYNGENFIKQALDSILKQTFKDFELVICDNASMDNTEKICRAYAKKDKRIRYYRNQKNLGANPNYNKTFKLSRGKYFKWAAHDDMLAPTFLEKCVKILDNKPSVVLCCAKEYIVDELGKYKREAYHKDIIRMDSEKPCIRFNDFIVKEHESFPIFGLIRRDALEKTSLLVGYCSSDTVLLARLALLGKFYQIPEKLLILRDHAKQSVKFLYTKDIYMYAVWYDQKNKNRIIFPRWKLFYDYLMSPLNIKAGLNHYDVLSSVLSVFLWSLIHRNWLLADILIALKQIIGLPPHPKMESV